VFPELEGKAISNKQRKYSAHCKIFLFNRDEGPGGPKGIQGITSKIKSLLDLKQKESKLVVFKDVIPFIPFIPVKMFLVLVFYFDSAE
jgi:hypothetical protein